MQTRGNNSSQILHKKISTHLLIMEVDFCPVLCIVEMPVLQAFGVFSRFVWYRQIYRKCRKFVVKK